MEPIPYCKGEEVSKKIRASAYVECSALKSSNLDRVFETAIKLVPLKKKLIIN